jgi:chaperonin GroES
MMNFEPLGTRIAVKVEEAAKKTASGIIIPDSGQETPSIGKIVAINEMTKEDFGVDLGTTVVFAKYSGTEITLDKETFLIIEMDELFGIIRD